MRKIHVLILVILGLSLIGCQFLPGGDQSDSGTDVDETGQPADTVVEAEPTVVVVEDEVEPTNTPATETEPTNTPEPILPTSTPESEDEEVVEEEADSETEADTDEGDNASAEGSADTASSGAIVGGTVGDSGAQFFEEAGSATQMLTTLPAGDTVEILGMSSNEYWYEVETIEGIGWIPTSQIDVSDEALLDSVKKYSANLSANLSSKVRVGPSLDSPVYTTMQPEEEASILGVNGDGSWYQIETDGGKIGWISASIVTVLGDEGKGIARFNPRTGLSSNTASSSGTTAQQPAPTAAPVQNSGGGETAAPAPTSAPSEETAAVAPPAAPRPGDLYYSTDNGAFAGAGRMDIGTGNSQRGGCRGMTWTVLHQLDGITHVGSDLRTNPYAGDATCDQSYPILCIFKSGGGPPATSRPDLELNYYNSWAGAQVLSTGFVSGHQMPTLDAANKICADTFGSQYWQIAEFHDGNFGQGGWEFWANGTLPLGTRFWVAIDDQRANPWNSQ